MRYCGLSNWKKIQFKRVIKRQLQKIWVKSTRWLEKNKTLFKTVVIVETSEIDLSRWLRLCMTSKSVESCGIILRDVGINTRSKNYDRKAFGKLNPVRLKPSSGSPKRIRKKTKFPKIPEIHCRRWRLIRPAEARMWAGGVKRDPQIFYGLSKKYRFRPSFWGFFIAGARRL